MVTAKDIARAGIDDDELFTWAIEQHERNGIVIDEPDCFMLARPVRRIWDERRIIDPSQSFVMTVGQADMWHVWVAVGSLGELLDRAPYPLPFLSWERKNQLRISRFQKIQCLHGVWKAQTERARQGANGSRTERG